MLSARRESRVRGSLKAQACSLRALGFSGGELGNGREPDLPFKFNASFFGGWRFFFRCVLRLDACGSTCFCGRLAPLGALAADYRVGGCADAAHGGRKTEKCTLLDLPWQKKRVMHAFAARRSERAFQFSERQPSDLGKQKVNIACFAASARCSKKNRAFLEKAAS